MGRTQIILTIFFVLIEWIGRENQYAIEKLGLKWKRHYRWTMYLFFTIMIVVFSDNQQEFIYFQF
jgi:hypothetical protein